VSSSAAQIVALERRLAADRGVVRRRFMGLRRQLRRRATAPTTLLVAGAVGVLVERGSRNASVSMRGVWRAAVVSTTLARALRDLLASLDATQSAS
jgi:hypothetical protein